MQNSVFFTHVRKSLFNGRMTQAQVAGCERLIKAWDEFGYGLHTGMAYILAISYHETGQRMQPVREAHANSDAQAKARLERAWKAGRLKWVKTPYWRDGWYGRGDVQLTHEHNYSGALRRAVLDRFSVDIHADPDAVLRPEVSAFILVEGVTKGATNKADFTRWHLSLFINEHKTDYANARKTVNPAEKDSYEKIAQYAREFEAAIRAALEAADEEFRGPGPNIYDGRVSEEVRQVQRRLKELGYKSVGTIDGRWGSRTREAVLAFRADEDLPLVPYIDDTLYAQMVKSHGRANGAERQTATVGDLRREGSRTVKGADTQQAVAAVGAGATGLASLAPEKPETATDTIEKVTGAVDQAEGYLQYAQKAQGLIEPITTFVNDNLFVIIIVVLGVVAWKSGVLKSLRRDDHSDGSNTGR